MTGRPRCNTRPASAAPGIGPGTARVDGSLARPCGRGLDSATRPQPHFESPQFRQVMQPSIMITAAVLHFAHSCAPSG